jgi:hypothetical protein
MPLTTHRAETTARTDALAAIQDEIARLTSEQAKLHDRREAAKREALNSMADAFARKLQAAGFSVREGIQALRPYEKIKLDESTQPSTPTTGARRAVGRAPHSPPLTRQAQTSQVSAHDSAQQYAQRVLGAQWQAWMDQPHLLLGGERPKMLLSNPAGIAKVLALLDAYEHNA